MMDTRNEYRASSYIFATGELWKVEYRPWWWPFWNYIGWSVTLDRAKQFALEHAGPRKASIRIATFGRLP